MRKLFGHRPSDGIRRAVENLTGIPLQIVCRGAEEANAALMVTMMSNSVPMNYIDHTHTHNTQVKYMPAHLFVWGVEICDLPLR